jgi:hypothetical protein
MLTELRKLNQSGPESIVTDFKQAMINAPGLYFTIPLHQSVFNTSVDAPSNKFNIMNYKLIMFKAFFFIQMLVATAFVTVTDNMDIFDIVGGCPFGFNVRNIAGVLRYGNCRTYSVEEANCRRL